MLSNYPPGVTGNEDYFGPNHEYEKEVECLAEGADVFIIPTDLIDAYRSVRHDAELLRRWAMAVVGTEKVDIFQCPFVGPVNVQVWNHQDTWVCPMCGKEHEEDHE
jgi:hypothetical protein